MSTNYLAGIFHVGDHGTWEAGSVSLAQQQANQTTLIDTIQAAQANGGGVVLIPSVGTDGSTGNFELAGQTGAESIPIDTSSASNPIWIFGYGGVTLFKVDSYDLFVLTNQHAGRSTNPNGITFTDIQIQYATSTTAGIAINGTNADNLMLRRILFQNCLTAVSLTDTLEATMESCTVEYESGYTSSNGGTGLILTGSGGTSSGCEQFNMIDCLFKMAATLATGDAIVGILIEEATHGHLSNTSINGFTTGISLAPTLSAGTNTFVFNNIDINPMSLCQYAVLIQPTASGGSGGVVQNVKFVACDFNTSSSSPTAGVYINANSASGGTIDGVEFIGCSASGFTGPAIYVADAVHIEIIGGIYKNNAQSGTPKGQIALTGASGGTVSKINIVGVTCTGISSGSNQYGISVASGATLVYIRDCNLGNNGDGAINFGSGLTSSTIEVTNCALYNDQQTPINSNNAPTSSAHESAALNGYYGPSLVTCYIAAHAGTAPTVSVNGTTFTTPYNSFFSMFLNSPYDTILFSASLPSGSTFTWTGE